MAKVKNRRRSKSSELRSGDRTETARLADLAPSSSRTRTLLIGFLLFLAVLGAFLPVLQNGFLNFDDNVYITENRHVQNGLAGENILWAFRATAAANWHPLTWLSHMLDFQMFGLNAWGHHLSSVLLHATNAVLVFLVLQRLTNATWRSLAVAMLFSLHPLRVESVAWVAERKDVLSLFFGMLTLWAYTRFAEETRANPSRAKKFFALALLFFIAGLMSKPMLVSLPFVLLLLDFWPLNRWTEKPAKRLLVEKIPFLVLAAAASAITLLAQKQGGAVVVSLPLNHRIENAVVSYGRYLGKLFWPVKLSVIYPHPGSWPWPVVLLCAAMLGVFSFAAWRWRTQRPYLFVGWFWFLGTLVPVIGLIQVGNQSIADRYTYLPSLGIFILGVWAVSDVCRRFQIKPVLAGALGGGVLSVYALQTERQISYWKNQEILFHHALTVTTHNPIAHQSLGEYFLGQGRLDEALNEFQEALKLTPNHAVVLNEVGLIKARQGRSGEAFDYYRTALELNPDLCEAHINLGALLSDAGKYDDAIRELKSAVQSQPENATALYNLGLTLARKGDEDQGILWFQKALKLNPDYADAHFNLGFALMRKNRLDEAINEIQAVVRLEPNDAAAHNFLGELLLRRDATDEAIAEFEAALKLQPDFPAAQLNLNHALNKKAEGTTVAPK